MNRKFYHLFIMIFCLITMKQDCFGQLADPAGMQKQIENHLNNSINTGNQDFLKAQESWIRDFQKANREETDEDSAVIIEKEDVFAEILNLKK